MEKTIKNTIIAGAIGLASGACGIPHYTITRDWKWRCAKDGDTIAAQQLEKEAIKETDGYRTQITYTSNMKAEEAIKALDACEKAFEIKAEKEQ